MDFMYRFPTGFKLSEQLLGISMKVLNIPIDVPLRGILLTLQLKCHRMFAASIILMKNGYAIEVQSHIRSIMESLISAKYLIIDPIKHQEMFQNFVAIEKYKMVEDYEQAMKVFIDKRPIKDLDNPSEEEINLRNDYNEALKTLSKKKIEFDVADTIRNEWIQKLKLTGQKTVKDSWSLKNNYEMAQATGLDFYYLMVFKSFSNLVHPSSLSGEKYRAKTNGLIVDPSPLGIKRELIGACIMHATMTQAIAEFYSMDELINELESFQNEIQLVKNSDEYKEMDSVFGDI